MNHKRNVKTPLLGAMMIISMLLLTGCNLGEFGAKDSTDDKVMMEKSDEQAMMQKKNDTMVASYQAGKVQDFNQAAYEKAKADGKTVVLDFAADWCPTCQANKPKFKSAVEANGSVVAFEVNYDTEKELKKNYNVNSQTTYILIKDGKETDRTLGAKSEAQFTSFIGSGESMEKMEKSDEQAMMIKSEDEKKMMDKEADQAGADRSDAEAMDDSAMEKKKEDESMMKKEEKETMMEKKAYSAGIQNYTEAAFAAAVADGKTVALDFYASWCSVCKGNEPKLKSAVEGIDSNDLIVFTVDFDTERDLKKEYGVVSQSTYLLIKNGKEANRIAGPQSEEKFKTFLNS